MKTVKFYKNLESLLEVEKDNSSKVFMLVAEGVSFDSTNLNNSKLDYCGAIVPQVIFEDKNYEEGIVFCELNDTCDYTLLEDMSNIKLDEDTFDGKNSFTILLDGLSSNITYFVETIFEYVPSNSSVIGSGAGKLTLKQEPVIFSRKGIFQNAAIILADSVTVSVGVENGWTYLEGPFMVSDSEKNVLKTLNFEKAFDVYKRVVEKDSGLKFNDDNFFDIAKSYPFGIVKFNKDVVVRDPITLDENGNMVLVGDLEVNATVNILKGVKSELIASAKTAIKKIVDNNEVKSDFVMLFDCISRCIYLEDEYQKEINNIAEEIPGKKLFGALTLGEISNRGDEYIFFYNKTCVIGAQC